MWKIESGNVCEVLDKLPEQYVHCVVTSPPYYGLRNYNLPPIIWDGESDCEHHWTESEQPITKLGIGGNTNGVGKDWINPGKVYAPSDVPLAGLYCVKCGAWMGSLGLEPSIELFVEHIVQVFRKVWRVLRDDGTVWLNLGDSYAGAGTRTEKHANPGLNKSVNRSAGNLSSRVPQGVKKKDLIGMPWRVALALQSDGWYLRSDIIWHKLNPLPESIRDRPSKSHEYVFLLTKNEKYFYDNDAIRLPLAESSVKRISTKSFWEEKINHDNDISEISRRNRKTLENFKQAVEEEKLLGANKRTVWSMSNSSQKLSHDATFPVKLVEPCIMAGTSEKGVCSKCGMPYKRTISKKPSTMNLRVRNAKLGISHNKTGFDGSANASEYEIANYGKEESAKITKAGTTWSVDCDCNAAIIPATVMDIFSGSGTTGVAALRHGRSYVGIELNQNYIDISRNRIINDAPLFNTMAEIK